MRGIFGLRGVQSLSSVAWLIAQRGLSRTAAASRDTLIGMVAVDSPASATPLAGSTHHERPVDMVAVFHQLMDAVVSGIGILTSNREVLSSQSFAVTTMYDNKLSDSSPGFDLSGLELRVVSFGRRYGWAGVPLPRLMWRRHPIASLRMSSGLVTVQPSRSQRHTFTARIYSGFINRNLRRIELQLGAQFSFLHVSASRITQLHTGMTGSKQRMTSESL